jgi:pimeloyl-ACP methyl ester carboxylesterase
VGVGRAVLNDQEISYVEVDGDGPVLLLLHGIGSSLQAWDTVLPFLTAQGAHVVALDLPGHGGSGRSHGDYSLGSLACTVRDLMDHLGLDRVILVGHSLGGGIAMQFAYQFPDRVSGLVLVASGGLGREASVFLRAASLPGAEVVISALAHPRTLSTIATYGRVTDRVRRRQRDDPDGDGLETLRDLRDPDTRAAFLATLRSVVDVSGQRVSAVGKLSTAAALPTLLIWGDLDPIIPWEHGRRTVEQIPTARLVTFPGAGHEPHRFDPERFAQLLVTHARLVAEQGAAVTATGTDTPR